MNTNLVRYFRIFGIQIRNNMAREILYRTNFFTMALVDVIWIFIEFSLFTVIYSNVDTLGGWTKPQIYFFLGIFFSSDALFTAFFQRNFWQFSDLVSHGELDTLLTKPAPALFLALTRYMNVTALFNFCMGIAITIRYSTAAGFAGGTRWLYLPLWLLFGLCAALLLRMFFSVWVFWTDRSFAISRLYYQFFAFATKPDTIYPFWIRYFILTAFPFAFIGSVPARALLQGLSIAETLQVSSVLLIFLLLNSFLWKKGMQRYQSASS